MKKLFLASLMLAALNGCKKEEVIDLSQNSTLVENTKVENPTTVQFNKTEHDFGTIKQGEIVETDFVITNTGEKDLLITEAFGSCGCTVPKVTKEPIKPGASTPIHVKFDSNGKQGNVQKTVTIKCNTKNIIEQVKIKANILTK